MHVLAVAIWVDTNSAPWSRSSDQAGGWWGKEVREEITRDAEWWLLLCRTLTSMFRGRWRVEMPRKWGGFFRNDAEHRDFTAIGTAAGAHLLTDSHSFAAPPLSGNRGL